MQSPPLSSVNPGSSQQASTDKLEAWQRRRCPTKTSLALVLTLARSEFEKAHVDRQKGQSDQIPSFRLEERGWRRDDQPKPMTSSPALLAVTDPSAPSADAIFYRELAIEGAQTARSASTRTWVSQQQAGVIG